MTGPRLLLYCQHLLGIGHYVRATRLAAGLSGRGFAVTLVSGGLPVPHLPPPPGVTLHQLPPLRAANATFSTWLTADGQPASPAWQARRAAMLMTLYQRLQPDMLLIEAFPFGRRRLRHELLPLLRAARAARRPVVCSLRDILVPRKPERVAESLQLATDWFDLVLIHGDPDWIPIEASFPGARALGDRCVYTGYVAPPVAAPGMAPPDRDGPVIVSTGGGAVGASLLRLALAARPLSRLRDHPWLLLTGGAAVSPPPGVTALTAVADLPARFRQCRLSISQAGYNTVAELLAAGCPAVCVPFATGSETEQGLRCTRLAARGLIESLPPEASPAALVAAVDRAQPMPDNRPASDGARRSADLLQTLWQRHTGTGHTGTGHT